MLDLWVPMYIRGALQYYTPEHQDSAPYHFAVLAPQWNGSLTESKKEGILADVFPTGGIFRNDNYEDSPN